jgi:hypothetical protein
MPRWGRGRQARFLFNACLVSVFQKDGKPQGKPSRQSAVKYPLDFPIHKAI